MIAAGQRHIERLVSRVRDANTEDPAHSTGTQAIVSFHVHEHGNSGNVAKASDDVGVEGEKASREGIICRHADREFEQFTHERIDEGVCVPWLFWTRYDPSTKDVVLSKALIWREIVVEYEEDPRGMLPLLKRSEAVGGEAECDITMIREVIVRVRLVSNNNTLSKKRAIMEPIENIRCRSRPAGLCVLIGTVLELSGVGAIRH
jgi:hypothetical protein